MAQEKALGRKKRQAAVDIRGEMAVLHRQLRDRIHEPSIHRISEAVDDTAARIWQISQDSGLEPFFACLDPYCDCKIALNENRPPTLLARGT